MTGRLETEGNRKEENLTPDSPKAQVYPRSSHEKGCAAERQKILDRGLVAPHLSAMLKNLGYMSVKLILGSKPVGKLQSRGKILPKACELRFLCF